MVASESTVYIVQKKDNFLRLKGIGKEVKCKFNFLYFFSFHFLLAKNQIIITQPKKIHPRQRMRYSNKKAREWMLQRGFDEIFFLTHARQKHWVHEKTKSYKCMDMWNLFDGACFYNNEVVFFQIKTNSWANSNTMYAWVTRRVQGTKVLSINVKGSESKEWKVYSRLYEKTGEGVTQRTLK